MREITASGHTVEDAIASALKQLGLNEDEVETEVIDEGKKGIFGIFGSALAVVKVSEKENVLEVTAKYLEEVTKNMGIESSIEIIESDHRVIFELTGDKIGLLIGKRGKTLNALQYLTRLVMNRYGHIKQSVIVDAEGYRERREDTLKDLANKMKEKALRINKKIALEPMPAYERKIIHSALQNDKDIATYSEGKDPHRHIIIVPNQIDA